MRLDVEEFPLLRPAVRVREHDCADALAHFARDRVPLLSEEFLEPLRARRDRVGFRILRGEWSLRVEALHSALQRAFDPRLVVEEEVVVFILGDVVLL